MCLTGRKLWKQKEAAGLLRCLSGFPTHTVPVNLGLESWETPNKLVKESSECVCEGVFHRRLAHRVETARGDCPDHG